ncbi:hypothetical protein EVAR_5475_1 [Eumeta japonica]|uniref:Uncharacterized protein n=1 Tax=Eumeta variegata TaxID=151549 RepID=A0A4C1TBD7_EUMVA|nr:hypothetical protein EVAR_5475_1 [Eumeta japonica]
MVPIFKVNVEPKEAYELTIVAINDKGESEAVVINQDEIIDKEIAGMAEPANVVADITTLSLALCGGVALLVLLACGLVLCTHERVTTVELTRSPSTEPPLCAYNTEGLYNRQFKRTVKNWEKCNVCMD